MMSILGGIKKMEKDIVSKDHPRSSTRTKTEPLI